jgi:hypothetical protein
MKLDSIVGAVREPPFSTGVSQLKCVSYKPARPERESYPATTNIETPLTVIF